MRSYCQNHISDYAPPGECRDCDVQRENEAEWTSEMLNLTDRLHKREVAAHKAGIEAENAMRTERNAARDRVEALTAQVDSLTIQRDCAEAEAKSYCALAKRNRQERDEAQERVKVSMLERPDGVLSYVAALRLQLDGTASMLAEVYDYVGTKALGEYMSTRVRAHLDALPKMSTVTYKLLLKEVTK